MSRKNAAVAGQTVLCAGDDSCGDSSPFSGACGTPLPPLKRGGQLVKKGFDKLVDGEASSPATTTLTSFC